MADWTGARDVIVGLGDAAPTEALAILDRGLLLAEEASDSRAVLILARHAGVIASDHEPLERAIAYYEKAVQVAPGDAGLHHMMGDLYGRLGERAQAREWHLRCLQLYRLEGDDEMAVLVASRLGD